MINNNLVNNNPQLKRESQFKNQWKVCFTNFQRYFQKIKEGSKYQCGESNYIKGFQIDIKNHSKNDTLFDQVQKFLMTEKLTSKKQFLKAIKKQPQDVYTFTMSSLLLFLEKEYYYRIIVKIYPQKDIIKNLNLLKKFINDNHGTSFPYVEERIHKQEKKSSQFTKQKEDEFQFEETQNSQQKYEFNCQQEVLTDNQNLKLIQTQLTNPNTFNILQEAADEEGKQDGAKKQEFSIQQSSNFQGLARKPFKIFKGKNEIEQQQQSQKQIQQAQQQIHDLSFDNYPVLSLHNNNNNNDAEIQRFIDNKPFQEQGDIFQTMIEEIQKQESQQSLLLGSKIQSNFLEEKQVLKKYSMDIDQLDSYFGGNQVIQPQFSAQVEDFKLEIKKVSQKESSNFLEHSGFADNGKQEIEFEIKEEFEQLEIQKGDSYQQESSQNDNSFSNSPEIADDLLFQKQESQMQFEL